MRGYRTGVATTVPQRSSFDDVTDEQVESFRRDGFLIVEEGLVSMAAVELLRGRFAALFDGDYPTGIAPDEVNWKRGRDRDDVTRQICNGWRADDVIAAQVLSETTGRIAARLGGYRGTRMLQDNCLWKPPGTKSLGMHQDGSYAGYLSPPEMITCWVALDETFAQGGTIEYVRGSHLWPKAPPDRGSFHAPDNWLAPLDGATPEGVEPERVPVVVKPGGCAFHHSLTFHGSGPNES
jgi:ectoine hydroxylase-related dioxygenase (phytanoyl-CoA dioxygenase family)